MHGGCCLDQEGKRADAVVVVGFWICAVRMPDKGQRSGPYGGYSVFFCCRYANKVLIYLCLFISRCLTALILAP